MSALSRLQLLTDVPTLVIWGDADPIIPVEHGHEVHLARPNSRLEVLPGIGHFPQVEAPDEVAAALEGFLVDTGRPDIRSLAVDLASRGEIDRAVGILMALRGCPQSEAIAEITETSRETRWPADDLGRALADVAGGADAQSSPLRAAAQDRWGHLLAARGLGAGRRTDQRIPDAVRIRNGPDNITTIC